MNRVSNSFWPFKYFSCWIQNKSHMSCFSYKYPQKKIWLPLARSPPFSLNSNLLLRTISYGIWKKNIYEAVSIHRNGFSALFLYQWGFSTSIQAKIKLNLILLKVQITKTKDSEASTYFIFTTDTDSVKIRSRKVFIILQ